MVDFGAAVDRNSQASSLDKEDKDFAVPGQTEARQPDTGKEGGGGGVLRVEGCGVGKCEK